MSKAKAFAVDIKNGQLIITRFVSDHKVSHRSCPRSCLSVYNSKPRTYRKGSVSSLAASGTLHIEAQLTQQARVLARLQGQVVRSSLRST